MFTIATRRSGDAAESRTSRRQLIFDAAAAVGVAGAFAAGLSPRSAAAAKVKMAQADIGYQPRPNGAQRCHLCVNWQAPSACKVVAGSISPSGWCGLFVHKA